MFEGYVDQTTISQQIIETNLLSESLTAYNEELKARVVDGKVYELSNHLGNVLSVVSDRKFARDEDGDGTIDHYQPEILLSQDYSPFGVLLYERVFDEYQPSAANNCSAQNTLVNEVTVNDIFDTNVEYWVPRGSTQLSTITWDAGRMKVSSPSRYLAIDRWFETVVGETYTVTYDGDNGNLPFVYVRVIDMAGNNIAGSSFNAAGQYTFTFTATSTTTRLAFSVPNVLSGAPFIYYIDNVTIEGNQIQYACPEADVFMDDFDTGMPTAQAEVTLPWTKTGGANMGAPTAVGTQMAVKPADRYDGVKKEFNTTPGKDYVLEFDMETDDFSRVRFSIANDANNAIVAYDVQDGNYKVSFTANSNTTRLNYSIQDPFVGDRYFYLDNVKVYSFDEETIASTGVKTRYRYGFNGMERDDEVKGAGNSYDFGNRMYNSRLGRFLSIDKRFALSPSVSTYAFVGSSPIVYVDIEGDTRWRYIHVKMKDGSEIVMKKPISGDVESRIVSDGSGTVNDIEYHWIYEENDKGEFDLKDIDYKLGRVRDTPHFLGCDACAGAWLNDYQEGGFVLVSVSGEGGAPVTLNDVETLNVDLILMIIGHVKGNYRKTHVKKTEGGPNHSKYKKGTNSNNSIVQTSAQKLKKMVKNAKGYSKAYKTGQGIGEASGNNGKTSTSRNNGDATGGYSSTGESGGTTSYGGTVIGSVGGGGFTVKKDSVDKVIQNGNSTVHVRQSIKSHGKEKPNANNSRILKK